MEISALTADAGLQTQPSGLRRSLKLWHLVLYGIIIIQPTAPMSIYGVVSNAAAVAVYAVQLAADCSVDPIATEHLRRARRDAG